jgi:polyhydroxybutyrate depolymerase
LYRHGFRAALRPTARACAVATFAVAGTLATPGVGATAAGHGGVPVAAALDAGSTGRANDSQAPAGACPGRSPSPCHVLAHGGRERTYRLYVPGKRVARPPLLVVLHGGGGHGAHTQATLGQRFDALADAAGVLVAYPDGVDRHWNDGRGDLPARTVQENVDDVGFLRALVAALAERYAVDRERVYVAGMSNGAMMSLRLACEAADTFRGVFAVAGNLGSGLAARCRPARVTRLALAFGTDDPIVPWAGGDVRAFGRTRGHVLSTRDTWATFTAAARCRSERSDAPQDRERDDGTELVVHRAVDCEDDADLRLYEVRGGGHVWPGRTARDRPRLTGRATRELDASAEAWAFFGLDRAVR